MRVLFRTNAVDNRVRATLVATLYTQPASLALGAICGIAASLPAALQSDIPLIFNTTMALVAVATARVIMAYALPRVNDRNSVWLELAFEAGAFSYALLVGVLAAMVNWYEIPPSARALVVVYGAGYGAGIAARNAGRPAIAPTSLEIRRPMAHATATTATAIARSGA